MVTSNLKFVITKHQINFDKILFAQFLANIFSSQLYLGSILNFNYLFIYLLILFSFVCKTEN